jgi:hypothetical protein
LPRLIRFSAKATDRSLSAPIQIGVAAGVKPSGWTRATQIAASRLRGYLRLLSSEGGGV